MKYAYSTLACPDWTIQEALEKTTEYGYDGIEIRLIDGETVNPDISAAERDRVAKIFADSDVPVFCLDSSLRFAEADEDARKKLVEDAATMAEVAKHWGTDLVRVFGGNFPEGMSKDEVFKITAENLQRAGEKSGKLGVRLVLETHDAFCLGADVAAVLEQVDNEYVGVLWDWAHPYRTGEPAEKTFEYLEKWLWHAHVKDGKTQEGSHAIDLCLAGEGDVPFEDIAAAYKKLGYDKFISVEWEKKWHPEIEEPEVALPQYLAYLKKLFA